MALARSQRERSSSSSSSDFAWLANLLAALHAAALSAQWVGGCSARRLQVTGSGREKRTKEKDKNKNKKVTTMVFPRGPSRARCRRSVRGARDESGRRSNCECLLVESFECLYHVTMCSDACICGTLSVLRPTQKDVTCFRRRRGASRYGSGYSG